jgi:hypothetical protein
MTQFQIQRDGSAHKVVFMGASFIDRCNRSLGDRIDELKAINAEGLAQPQRFGVQQ